MKNRVNGKAVLILAGVLAVLGVVVHFLHAYQVKRNAHDLYDQALVVEQEGQLAQAADYLEQYLGLAPGDNDALARLGVLLDRQAKTPRARARAFFVLEQVLRREDGRKDIRRRVARIATGLGQYTDAEHHVKVLLKDAPEDAELLQLMGRCAMASLKFDEAEEWYRKAQKLAPNQIDLAVEYAALLRHRLEQPGIADERIKAMVRANEQSPEARLEGARYFRRHGLWTEAEKHVKFAIDKLGVQDVEVLLLAADVARANGKPAESRKHLERARELYPKDGRVTQALGRLELAEGERARALRYLEESIKYLPDEAEELRLLGVSFLDAGDVEQAKALAKRLGQRGAATSMRCLQAQILMHEQAWGEARAMLEKLETGRGVPRELAPHIPYLLALCYERLANPDQRLGAYQRAVVLAPHWPAARRGLAQSLAALGKVDRALAEYRALLRDAPQFRGELVQLMIARNARLPAAAQQWDEIDSLLRELTPTAAKPAEVQLMRGQALALRGKLDEAQKLIETQRQENPRQPAPWLFLVALAEKQGKPAAVLPLLDAAEKQAGKRVEWQLARAGYWARHGGKAAPEQLRQLAARAAELSEADRPRLLRVLAESLDALGDTASEALWRQLAQLRPKDLALQLVLFERASAAGKQAEIQAALAQIKQLEADGGPMTAYAEAANLIAQARAGDLNQLAQARAHLAQAAELRPSWSRVPLMEAEAFDVENRPDKALEKYQAALERGDGRLFVVRRVLRLLYQQQRYAEAAALIRKLPEQALAVRDLGQIAAALALAPGAPAGPDTAGRDEALRLARKSARDHPKDYRDQLWLGQVAATVGKTKEAEQAFRQARTLGDTVPATWAALILFLAPRDAKAAEAELTAAQAKLTKDAFAPVRAAAYEALGRTPQAEEQYLAALAAKPDDAIALFRAAGFFVRTSQLAKAEPHLRKLIDPQTGAPRPARAWARRELALTLAQRRTYPLFTEALRLLDANAVNGTEAIEDRRVRAIVMATQPAHRRDAIRLLEQLPSQAWSGSPTGQFLLAQLYDADGKWPRARAMLTAILAEHDKNPVYVARFVRSLVRHKELDTAETWVAKLAVLAPREFETMELQARVLQARGKPKEATKLIQAYTREKDARLELAARLLEQLGHDDEAEAIYRAVAAASKQPEAVLTLAQHLSRRHLAEALDLCEKAWKTCPADKVGFAAVYVARTGKAAPDQYARVEGWLTSAMAKHADKPLIAVAYAELLDNRGRYADSIRIYRQILDKNPRNVVVLNNLAFLLVMHESRPAEALALADRAIAIAGPHPELLDTRAVIQLKSGKADVAVADLNKAIALAPTPAMYLHLAQAQRLAKNALAVETAFRNATEIGIQAASLHPLERPAFVELTAALKKK